MTNLSIRRGHGRLLPRLPQSTSTQFRIDSITAVDKICVDTWL